MKKIDDYEKMAVVNPGAAALTLAVNTTLFALIRLKVVFVNLVVTRMICRNCLTG
ncbi:hypothetical protein [Pedobacter quisquiliarum]|uniref:hypothetical protein n=1 Tax=Pedobacter quisquiliarum TaxID=1834438 RepID=UPI001667EC61|nr:hypothetical protein [Pedobacter quisquiliarum]